MNYIKKIFNSIGNRRDNKIRNEIYNKLFIPNERELDIIKTISDFVSQPLADCKSLIDENSNIKFCTFLYLVGNIDGCSQYFKIKDDSFNKIYHVYFLDDLKIKNYDFYKFSQVFHFHYNKMLEYEFISEIITLGGKDIISFLEFRRKLPKLNRSSHLKELLSELIKLPIDKHINEIKEFSFQDELKYQIWNKKGTIK
jgi:hypothetical protein